MTRVGRGVKLTQPPPYLAATRPSLPFASSKHEKKKDQLNQESKDIYTHGEPITKERASCLWFIRG